MHIMKTSITDVHFLEHKKTLIRYLCISVPQNLNHITRIRNKG